MDQREVLATRAMQAAQWLARRRFRKHPDREELTADAVSMAWELFQTASDRATPLTVAKFAVRRVVIGRQFPQSVRSIDSDFRQNAELETVELTELVSGKDDPAEVAITAVDFAAWRATLTPRYLEWLDAILWGEDNRELAVRFRCSWGRVSQVRRQLWEWLHRYWNG